MESASLNGDDITDHSFAASNISFTGSDLVEQQLFKCKQCNKTFTQNISISQPATVESKEGDTDNYGTHAFSQTCRSTVNHHKEFSRQASDVAFSSISSKEMPSAKSPEEVEELELSDGVTLALECEEQDQSPDEGVSDSERQLEAGFSIAEDGESIRNSLIPSFEPGSSGRARHVCTRCDESFVRKKDLDEHVGIHADGISATHVCSSCGKRFSQRRYLDTHVRKHACGKKTKPVIHSNKNHTGERPHACSSCGKTFARIHTLLVHQKIHSGAKPHVCAFCNKAFLYRKSLDCHLTVHTGEKQHVCAYCGKTYASKSNLVIHTRIHTGEKPFECSTCGEAFPYKTALLDHVIRTHAGEDSYRCSFCDKGFRSKITLVAHTRIHTGERPYVCALCHIAFKFKGNLVMHEKTHTGEKPFACSHCEKAFVRHSHLVRHSRIHTGEKPYACSSCDRAFTFREQLAVHCTRVHAEDKPSVVGTASALPCFNSTLV